MRIAIIGAGITGVAAAYELAHDGHQVSVFERQSGVATQASFAHGGLISPTLSAPWGALTPRPLSHTLAPRHWSWQLKAWRARRSPAHQAGAQRLHSLTQYSHARMRALRQQGQWADESSEGLLVLLRSTRELKAAQAAKARLDASACGHSWLDATQCRTLEPGLNPDMKLLAGLHLPHDGAANGRQFALLLKNEAQRLGAQFFFNATVRGITPGAKPELQLAATEHAPTRFDAVLLCSADASTPLLKSMGLHLPLQAIHGCSITAALRQFEAHPDLGPRAALYDEKHHVSLTRLGQRVRVAGGASLKAAAAPGDAEQLKRLHQVLHDWFPGAVQSGSVQRWQGARAMLPDGLPLLGASGHAGVWLNLAHANNGWAVACGAARVLADQIGGRPAEVDVEGLDVQRLTSA